MLLPPLLLNLLVLSCWGARHGALATLARRGELPLPPMSGTLARRGELPLPPMSAPPATFMRPENRHSFAQALAPLRLRNLTQIPAASQAHAIVVGATSGQTGGKVYIYSAERCATPETAPLSAAYGPDTGRQPLLTLDRTGLGGFYERYSDGARFGNSLANLGDLDGDGVEDLAVGTDRDGVFFVLLMCENASAVREIVRHGGPGGLFGSCLANVGDVDGDGVIDLAVGARDFSDGAGQSGAVFLLFMQRDGTARETVRISNSAGGFENSGFSLPGNAEFGRYCAPFRDAAGVPHVAVGAETQNDVYIIPLNTTGVGGPVTKLRSIAGNARFGQGLASVDLDGDGVQELAISEQASVPCAGSQDCNQLVIYYADGFPNNFTILHPSDAGAPDQASTFKVGVAGIGDMVAARIRDGFVLTKSAAIPISGSIASPCSFNATPLQACGPVVIPTTGLAFTPLSSKSSQSSAAGGEADVVLIVVIAALVVVCVGLAAAFCFVRRRRAHTDASLPESSDSDGAVPPPPIAMDPIKGDHSEEFGNYQGQDTLTHVMGEYNTTDHLDSGEYNTTTDVGTIGGEDTYGEVAEPIEYGDFNEAFGDADSADSPVEYGEFNDTFGKAE